MNTIKKLSTGAINMGQVEEAYKLSKEVRTYLLEQIPQNPEIFAAPENVVEVPLEEPPF